MNIDQIPEKYLTDASTSTLVVTQSKNTPYNITRTNNTILDRAYPNIIKDDEMTYSSIAHYIAYQKIKIYDMPFDVIKNYKNLYTIPLTDENTEENPFETEMLMKYCKLFDNVPDELKMQYREQMLKIACEAILLAIEQIPAFKQELIKSKNTVIIEMSKHFVWGTDCSSNNILTLAYPKNWNGDNYYGQALTACREYLIATKKYK